MKRVSRLELKKDTREERLPDFSGDFPYLASCAELDRYPQPLVPWHWHNALELFYMESGSLEYTTPGGTWVFPQGSGGLVNSNVLHTSRPLGKGVANVQLLHLFSPSLLAEAGSRMEEKYILPITGPGAPEVIPLDPQDPRQGQILTMIRQAFDLDKREWGYEFRVREALTRIWLALFPLAQAKCGRGGAGKRGSDRVKGMLAYIRENDSGEITVEDLAASVHISKRACFRLFRELLHTTPQEYIRDCRLRRAGQLLRSTDIPVTEIALLCGFSSGSYFGKCFRERYGTAPLAYRKDWHDRDSICQNIDIESEENAL